MNMKDAFRFQNKLKGLMCEATAILQDRRNIVKVKTTHLRSKVMSDTQDAVVEEAAPSEYAGHANEVAAFLMSLLEEREKLCQAIHAAKNSLDLDIYTGKALAPLPFVDGLRLLKSEIVLEISDCQAAILPEPADIRPGSHRIDDRKLNHGHMDRLHSSG